MQIGDRVELVSCSDPFTRLLPGDQGTISHIKETGQYVDWTQIDVDWDSGSNLTMIPEEGDRIRVIR